MLFLCVSLNTEESQSNYFPVLLGSLTLTVSEMQYKNYFMASGECGQENRGLIFLVETEGRILGSHPRT